jgi:uncharacterized surface protein with fasciclin (FAS1) repeats
LPAVPIGGTGISQRLILLIHGDTQTIAPLFSFKSVSLRHLNNFKKMKVRNVLLPTGIVALFALMMIGCGDNGKAMKEQARVDSLRVADSMMVVQRVADSLAALPKSIAETAVGTADLSTLVAALTAGELVEVFKAPGAYTVFAPTNEAFAAIQPTVDVLLKAENKGKLQNVLKYHVVPGTFFASDLQDGQELTTLQGEKLKVSVKDGKVMIGDAEVISADVEASNGVVHVIGKVLVPKKM